MRIPQFDIFTNGTQIVLFSFRNGYTSKVLQSGNFDATERGLYPDDALCPHSSRRHVHVHHRRHHVRSPQVPSLLHHHLLQGGEC